MQCLSQDLPSVTIEMSDFELPSLRDFAVIEMSDLDKPSVGVFDVTVEGRSLRGVVLLYGLEL